MTTTTKPREPRTRRLRRLAFALALGTSVAWATVGGAGVARADLPPGPTAQDLPPGPGVI
jgi:hypothetical protein